MALATSRPALRRSRQRRRRALLGSGLVIVLAGLAVAALLVISLGGIGGTMAPVGAQVGPAIQAWSAGAFGPVLTVGGLQRAVARDPGRWLGQTVQVRGQLDDVLSLMCPGDPVCVGQPTLDDAAAVPAGRAARLPLAWGGPDPLWGALLRLPLLGRLLPRPQAPRWGAVERYRVRLDAVPGASCGVAICFRAVLLDVAQRDVCYPRHRETTPFACGGPNT